MFPSDKKIKDLGEFGLIKRLARLTRVNSNVVCGLGDDAAVLKYTRDKYLLFTTDMLIEKVHFTRSMPPEAIGRKALAVNISDIAAMGGKPGFAVISVGLPKDLKLVFAEKIYKGILKLAREFGISIVGGDTNQSKDIIINISLLGQVKKRHLVLRSTAQGGDLIWVTGRLGNSFLSGKHLNFTPRLKFSEILVKKYKPSAMIDISDGLVLDLSHILEMSHCGAVIYENLIPRAEGAKLQNALYDGEDFELLFTLPRNQARHFLDSLKHNREEDIPVSFIGEITSRKNKILLADRWGKTRLIPAKGFTHF